MTTNDAPATPALKIGAHLMPARIPTRSPYIARAEARIKTVADKVIDNYNKGLLTFDDFMTELHTIEDSRIYEEEAAADEARDEWEDRRARALGLD